MPIVNQTAGDSGTFGPAMRNMPNSLYHGQAPSNLRPPISPWLQGGQGSSPQVSNPSSVPSTHPLFQGREMAHQMPPTPHSGAVHQLLNHAVPIYHQISALKKALGGGKGKSSNNPGGVANF